MLKKRFITELILVALDLDKKMRIEVNILDYATEEILSMKFEDGKQRLIYYLSKLLNETEQNYEIHNTEILVVIKGLEAWM